MAQDRGQPLLCRDGGGCASLSWTPISRLLRTHLEEQLWRPIEAQATLEALADDPAFLADPGHHPAIFADHGVVHVRDVAIGLLRLLDTINGVLLPERPPARQRFVETVGVATAYLHDIGMVDMTPAGRRVHALFAPTPRSAPRSTHWCSTSWRRDRSARAWTMSPLGRPMRRRWRSSFASCSASASPTASRLFRPTCSTIEPCSAACSSESSSEACRAPRRPPPATGGRALADPVGREHGGACRSGGIVRVAHGPGRPQAELADDVVDAIQALRAADVLRQRGTVLRTSGGRDLHGRGDRARRLHAQAGGGNAAYVIIYDDERGAGEANIRGRLRHPRVTSIAFHRGASAASRRADAR